MLCWLFAVMLASAVGGAVGQQDGSYTKHYDSAYQQFMSHGSAQPGAGYQKYMALYADTYQKSVEPRHGQQFPLGDDQYKKYIDLDGLRDGKPANGYRKYMAAYAAMFQEVRSSSKGPQAGGLETQLQDTQERAGEHQSFLKQSDDQSPGGKLAHTQDRAGEYQNLLERSDGQGVHGRAKRTLEHGDGEYSKYMLRNEGQPGKQGNGQQDGEGFRKYMPLYTHEFMQGQEAVAVASKSKPPAEQSHAGIAAPKGEALLEKKTPVGQLRADGLLLAALVMGTIMVLGVSVAPHSPWARRAGGEALRKQLLESEAPDAASP